MKTSLIMIIIVETHLQSESYTCPPFPTLEKPPWHDVDKTLRKFNLLREVSGLGENVNIYLPNVQSTNVEISNVKMCRCRNLQNPVWWEVCEVSGARLSVGWVAAVKM